MTINNLSDVVKSYDNINQFVKHRIHEYIKVHNDYYKKYHSSTKPLLTPDEVYYSEINLISLNNDTFDVQFSGECIKDTFTFKTKLLDDNGVYLTLQDEINA